MRTYELIPTNGRKSFYHKAIVKVENDNTETLYSYGVPIITRYPDQSLKRLWDGWSNTTGTHIKSFVNLTKSEFLKLPLNELYCSTAQINHSKCFVSDYAS